MQKGHLTSAKGPLNDAEEAPRDFTGTKAEV